MELVGNEIDAPLQVPPAADALMRRNDPEHLALVKDVGAIKSDVADVKEDVRDFKQMAQSLDAAVIRLNDAAEENQRRMMGHWDDTLQEWRPGLLQSQQELKYAIETAAQSAERTAVEASKRITGAIVWVGGIVSAIIVGSSTAYITVLLQQHASTINTIQSHTLR